MVSLKKVIKELKTVDREVRIAPHTYRRAKQRNVNIDTVKRKIRDLEILSARKNPEKDTRFRKTYKVTVKDSDGRSYELPIYFNMKGTEIYVKSVWNK